MWRFTAKIYLAVFLVILSLAGLILLKDGIQGFADGNWGEEQNALLQTGIEEVCGQLPYLGILLDSKNTIQNLYTGEPYRVFHDTAKTLVLLLLVHGLYAFLGKLLRRWRTEQMNLFALFGFVGDLILVSGGIFASVMIGVAGCEKLLAIWVRSVGDGAGSNWGLFVVLLVLLILTVFVLPGKKRMVFLFQVEEVLVDLGLVVSTVFTFRAGYLTACRQDLSAPIGEYLAMAGLTLLGCVATLVLVNVKRKKRS